MSNSIVTLQKHVRGWITRKRFLLLKERQNLEMRMKQEQMAKEKKNGKYSNDFSVTSLF
jgi:hypothetical protein